MCEEVGWEDADGGAKSEEVWAMGGAMDGRCGAGDGVGARSTTVFSLLPSQYLIIC